jgi:hypothetical protein
VKIETNWLKVNGQVLREESKVSKDTKVDDKKTVQIGNAKCTIYFEVIILK